MAVTHHERVGKAAVVSVLPEEYRHNGFKHPEGTLQSRIGLMWIIRGPTCR